mmetsp:Transcript_3474/g.5271  ORF Transcript_3474/g.5271 Transcript_3474/m.5271 type:complete len:309 (+) Transcript_3474:469-1395(+)
MENEGAGAEEIGLSARPREDSIGRGSLNIAHMSARAFFVCMVGDAAGSEENLLGFLPWGALGVSTSKSRRGSGLPLVTPFPCSDMNEQSRLLEKDSSGLGILGSSPFCMAAVGSGSVCTGSGFGSVTTDTGITGCGTERVVVAIFSCTGGAPTFSLGGMLLLFSSFKGLLCCAIGLAGFFGTTTSTSLIDAVMIFGCLMSVSCSAMTGCVEEEEEEAAFLLFIICSTRASSNETSSPFTITISRSYPVRSPGRPSPWEVLADEEVRLSMCFRGSFRRSSSGYVPSNLTRSFGSFADGTEGWDGKFSSA